jgi:23S rRNA pseudouridine955/2504/2580 synthase
MIIQADDDGQRLDRFLKKAYPDLSFGQTQKLIRTGQIRLNGKRCKADTRLCAEDELRLPPSLVHDSQPGKHYSQKDHDFIASLVLFEDEDILAINKPPRLAVQGGSKTTRHLDGMMDSYTKKGVKPRLCHRLDRDTSGVLIFGKTAQATRDITHQFQSHSIQKTYWALTAPAPIEDNGTIDAKISKSAIGKRGEERMVFDPNNGQKAITDFEVLDRAGKDVAFVAFYPKTGRTHQIRVHAELIGSPLLGDQKYNPTPAPFDQGDLYEGLHLHAHSISLRHPSTNKEIIIEAPLPKTFVKSWKSFGFNV